MMMMMMWMENNLKLNLLFFPIGPIENSAHTHALFLWVVNMIIVCVCLVFLKKRGNKKKTIFFQLKTQKNEINDDDDKMMLAATLKIHTFERKNLLLN